MENLEKYEVIADKFKALAHSHRLCIVNGLLNGASNVGKIQECLSIPQSTVSQHLSKLKGAGIIKGKRVGTEIVYSVVDQEVIELMKICLNDKS